MDKTVSSENIIKLSQIPLQNAVQISTPRLRACLQGGGGPQVGEVTRLGGVTRLSAQSLILIWSRLHDR